MTHEKSEDLIFRELIKSSACQILDIVGSNPVKATMLEVSDIDLERLQKVSKEPIWTYEEIL